MRASEFLSELQLPKGSWVSLEPASKAEVSDELINLVQNAYSSTQYGSFVNDQSDVNSSDWLILDWDHQDDVDSTIFYRAARPTETWQGFKIQGLGQDGQALSKKKAVSKICELLHKPGWWIESSDAMRSVLLKSNVPAVTDVDLLRRLFNDPSLNMISSDTYRRQLSSSKEIVETVFGKPVLK